MTACCNLYAGAPRYGASQETEHLDIREIWQSRDEGLSTSTTGTLLTRFDNAALTRFDNAAVI